MRLGRDAWALIALLLVFIAAMAYYAQRSFEGGRADQPTTYNAGPGGTKALYQLLQRVGKEVERFERPLENLPPDAGLLVMFEPFERPVEKEEKKALLRWVEEGGTLLFVVSPKASAPIEAGLVLDEVDVQRKRPAPATLRVDPKRSPYFRDVRSLRVDGATRLQEESGKTVQELLLDAEGAYIVAWRQGKGTVLVTTGGVLPGNARIAEADNAIFFVNVVDTHTFPDRPLVLFDEYHQGFGYATAGGRSLWQAMGAPARMLVYYLVFGFLLFLYNANRRFGAALHLAAPSYRPSTEYIASMASLYRRAGAADIALETIYRAFTRDLALRLDVPPNATWEQVADLAARRFGWNARELRDLMHRCEKVVEGEKIGEHEMMHLAKQIQEYRRSAELVRVSWRTDSFDR